jgi:hypothetical protein
MTAKDKDDWETVDPGDWSDEGDWAGEGEAAPADTRFLPPEPPGPSIAESAWEDIKGGAKLVGTLATETLNPYSPENIALKAGEALKEGAKKGELGKTLYGAVESAVTPLVESAADVAGPFFVQPERPLQAAKQAAENIARKPFTTALNVATVVPGVGEAALLKTGKILEKAGTIGKAAAEKLALNELKPWLKSSDKDRGFGVEPERAILEEGLVAPTIEGALEKTAKRWQDVGTGIGNVLDDPKYLNARVRLTRDDVGLYLAKTRKELLKEFPETEAGVIERFDKTARDLLYEHDASGKILQLPDGSPVLKDFSNMTLREANDLKQKMYRMVKWVEDTPSTREASKRVNAALRMQAARVESKINAVAPELRPLNRRWRNLLGATSALRRRAVALGKEHFIPLSDEMMALIGAELGGGAGAASGVALNRILSATPIRTAGAQAIEKGGKAVSRAVGAAGEALQAPGAALTTGVAATTALQGQRALDSMEASNADYQAALDWVNSPAGRIDPRRKRILEVLSRRMNVQP